MIILSNRQKEMEGGKAYRWYMVAQITWRTPNDKQAFSVLTNALNRSNFLFYSIPAHHILSHHIMINTGCHSGLSESYFHRILKRFINFLLKEKRKKNIVFRSRMKMYLNKLICLVSMDSLYLLVNSTGLKIIN